MNGIQEYNKLYLNKINKILTNQPDCVKGFANYLSGASLTTKYSYIYQIINFIKYTNKSPNKLTFDDFSNYLSKIQYKNNGDMITSSYMIVVYSSLKKFNEYLYISKTIRENYMKNIKRPKSIDNQTTIIKRQNGFLTKDEIELYINHIYEYNNNKKRNISDVWIKRDSLIIKIFLITGIRCSALYKLDISSIDFDNNELIVTDKGSKVKIINLPERLIDDIKEWLKLRKEIIIDDNNALFISNRKRRMNQLSIANVVHKYSSCINGKNITPHKLRATYGTQLYNETGDIYFVQDCMGHSSPKTTELYIRDKQQIFKKASDIMSKIIN